MRVLVATRANHRCEYCRRPENASFVRFQVDHIVSVKHGGTTVEENLAYSCPLCNNSKGTDLGTFLDDEQQTLTRLFHPRKDIWLEHFEAIDDGTLSPLTGIGAATVKVLDLNHVNRILERIDLIAAGFFP